jgi:hypothetical protein
MRSAASTYGSCKPSRRCLGLHEEFDVSLPVISPLGKVLPAPFAVLLVDLGPDGVESELEPFSSGVGCQDSFGRSEASILNKRGGRRDFSRGSVWVEVDELTDLLSSVVKVEEVDHGKRISVLVIVNDKSKLVEEDLGIDLRGVLVYLSIHDDLQRTNVIESESRSSHRSN